VVYKCTFLRFNTVKWNLRETSWLPKS